MPNDPRVGEPKVASGPWNVLIVCTGNSARSLLAEAWLDRHGGTRWRAYSAGSRPKPSAHPMTLQVLQDRGYDIAGLRPKDVFDFAAIDAPRIDIVITVCDSAAESCPVFPAAIAAVHWGLPDPAAVTGDAAAQHEAFVTTLEALETRFRRLLEVDPATWSPRAIRAHLEQAETV